MPNLKNVNSRFKVPLRIIEGGSGTIHAVINEAPQTQLPSYSFNNPRRILRVEPFVPLRTGMVVETEEKNRFIVGHNGDSEVGRWGSLWRSFRLFETTGQYTHQRRVKRIDPVTGFDRDDGLETIGTIWGALEPLEREAFDRQMRTSVEQSRFISGQPVLRDDIVDGRPVIRADLMLATWVSILS